MAELERVHATLHQAITSVGELRSEGDTKKAGAEFTKVDSISRTCVELRSSIEAATKKAA